MARRIVTDTFLTITGPGTTIKVCRALQDSNGNVAVWWKPKVAPQRIYTVGKAGLAMRGNLVGPDGTVYTFRRRGVSCTWSICKGKFTTKQVAAWWPEDGATAASPKLAAAADAADAEPVPDPVRERAAAAARASRTRTRPVTASERRAARARARAARATKAAVAERRANAEQAADDIAATADKLDRALGGPGLDASAAEALRTPEADDGPLAPLDLVTDDQTQTIDAEAIPPAAEPAIPEPTAELVEEVPTEDAPNEVDGDPAADLHELVTDATNGDPAAVKALTEAEAEALGLPPTTIASNAEIRAWAADNGYQVSPRGKIPDAVRTAYANAEQAGA
jgi:hypothetical protein